MDTAKMVTKKIIEKSSGICVHVSRLPEPLEQIYVVRDDLYPGGTKARFITKLFDDCDELVYASPAEGGAQTALATVAKQLGKRATIFVAKRKEQHPRVEASRRLGAKVVEIEPGHLVVVQHRAKFYASMKRGAKLLPFGLDLPEAEATISAAARVAAGTVNVHEVWCAYGSGTLFRALHAAFPKANMNAVQVGRPPRPEDRRIAKTLAEYPKPFAWRSQFACPFPCDPFYDVKAWEGLMARCRSAERLGFGLPPILFWNVTSPPELACDNISPDGRMASNSQRAIL